MFSQTIYYTHTDHLGSIISITDANGTEVFKASYDAWGKQTVTLNTIGFHHGYTGHEHLPEFGLINMNSRMYDPTVGRFLSPDPYVADDTYSQDFNRYTYARNNPLIYTDPTGENPLLIAAIVASAYLGGSSVNGNFNPVKWDWKDPKTYGGIAVGGLAGWAGASIGAGITTSALAGGSSTIGAGIAGGMMGGMASGGINGVGMTFVMGGNLNDALGNGIQGAVMGGFSGALSGGVGAAIGDFTGVAGSSFKNGMYELGHSALKGAATGLAGGTMMAAMTQDASYMWKGAAMGAAFSIGMAGLRIGLMGSTIIPPGLGGRFDADDAAFGIKSTYPIYRRGGLMKYFTPGITLGRNMMVDTRYLNSKNPNAVKWYHETLAHERAHIYQQKIMGGFNFYKRILYEYLINPGYSNNPYGNPNCLDYWADQYMYLTPFDFMPSSKNFIFNREYSTFSDGFDKCTTMGNFDKWIKMRNIKSCIFVLFVICNLTSCFHFIPKRGYVGCCTHKRFNYCEVDTSTNLWYTFDPSSAKIFGDSLLYEIMLMGSPSMLLDSFEIGCLYDDQYFVGLPVIKNTDKSYSYRQFVLKTHHPKHFLKSHILIVKPVVIRNGKAERLPPNEFRWQKRHQ
jgi:RHS repeat-associated protein